MPATVRSVLLVHVGEDGLGQGGQIFLVLAQRRQLDVEDVQTIEEIVAQMALRDGVFRGFVGCGQHANVDRGFALAAQAAKLAVFQHAQQLGLGGNRHLADFVEQQRAAFGQFEAADAALERAGECALFVTEDFAFDQRFRNRGAIDGDERLRLARAERVNGARDQFFSGAAFSRDQYRCRAGRDHLDEAEDLLHALRWADQRAENADVAQLAAAGFQFALGAAQARGVLQDIAQTRGIDRLLDEVEGAGLHGGNGGVDAALRGQQNNGDLLRLGGYALKQLHAVHARHAQSR